MGRCSCPASHVFLDQGSVRVCIRVSIGRNFLLPIRPDMACFVARVGEYSEIKASCAISHYTLSRPRNANEKLKSMNTSCPVLKER